MYNYIITTDDYKAGLNKIDEIRKSIDLEFDEVSYDLDDDGIYSIIDELSTISLFDNPKLIIVKSAEGIVNSSDKAINELCGIMNDIDSSNVLIFFITNNMDYSNPKYQKIKRFSTSIDIKIKNIPLDKYAVKEFEAEGYKIEEQALSVLCSYSLNMASLQQSIEILKCYKSDTKIITDKDVVTLVTKPLDDNIYQLIEAVLNNDKKLIFSCYNDLRIINIQPSYVVNMLINKFQELYNVQILVKSGSNQADISNLFNVSSGRAYYMIKNAKKANINEIKDNLKYLNDLEYKIKSGRVEQSLGLELYFLR